jgi:hypothetical protein
MFSRTVLSHVKEDLSLVQSMLIVDCALLVKHYAMNGWLLARQQRGRSLKSVRVKNFRFSTLSRSTLELTRGKFS